MADGTLVSRVYGGFRGVDFRGEEINLVRSPDSLNVWKDYRETESIRTRPDMELLESFDDTIYGIFFYKAGDMDIMLVHSGNKLYRVVGKTKTVIYTGLNRIKSYSFIYNSIWYLKDGKNYLKYDGQKVSDVRGYIPTTSIGRKPSGGGTVHEDVNMLSAYRINTFLGDGESTEYYLDAKDIDAVGPWITINDEDIESVEYDDYGNEKVNYTVDYEEGKITFTVAPPAPLTEGRDNVSIEFSKMMSGYGERIRKCTMLQVFDNRVFFGGNPDYPNTIWHCSLNDPSFCSDLDYYSEGLDASMVKGLVAGNNVLWVFKEPSQANTSVFYHTPTIDSEYGKIYPSTHSSVSTGCIGKAINFNDDIVFFSRRGMEGINGDITTEQAVAHRSSLVDRKLLAEPNYENMNLEIWDGYLMVFIDNKVYLADSRAVFTNDGHTEYEWYYWELRKNITYTEVNNGILYLGTDDGVYTLTNMTCDLESYWTTPKDKFNHPQHLKTTNKRGCVVEATGDVSVYVKTEKSDFELIGTYEDITDHLVSRIKRKKFKDIQLKFHSNTRFSLETATLECFVGGYLKR